VSGRHCSPSAGGVAGTNSPHHIASAGTYPAGICPKVRKTVVGFCEFTFTPVGFTSIVCAIAIPAAHISVKNMKVSLIIGLYLA
jgi:hypothetical protein